MEEGEGAEGVRMPPLVRPWSLSNQRLTHIAAEVGHLPHTEFFDPNIPGSSAFVLTQPPPPPMATTTTKKKATTKGAGAQRVIKKRPSKCALRLIDPVSTERVRRATKSTVAAATAAAAVQLAIHRDDAESIMSEGGMYCWFTVPSTEKL